MKRAIKAIRANKAYKVCKDYKAKKANREYRALKETLEQTGKQVISTSSIPQ